MNILNPTNLYWLLLIPPVVLLYFMKLRRKRFSVTAAFLWKKVMQDARVDSFFQKLKVNILLILQILFILFIVGALIRPYFLSVGSLTSETIFILDTSAAMKTLEGSKSRFAMAREKIEEVLKEAKMGSSYMLIGSSDRAEILSGLTSDKKKIESILSRMKPVDTPTDLKPAVLLALSLLKTHPDAEIILVGDKLPDEKEINVKGIAAFHFISVGKSDFNLGVTAFDVSRTGRDAPAEIFVRVENFSQKETDAFLEISYNGVLGEAREIKLPPSKGEGFVFTTPDNFSGTVKAELTLKDDFGVDNVVQACITKPDEVKLLLVSKKNPFLERLLSLLPGVSVEMTPPGETGSIDFKKYKTVIWNDCPVPVLTEGNHICIGCAYRDESLKSRGTAAYPHVVSWDKTHPLLRFVDISDPAISRSVIMDPPGGAKVIIRSDQGPLAFLVEEKNRREIHLLFSIYDTDWPLMPSFPMFMANAVNYLAERGGSGDFSRFKTGETVPLNFIPIGEKFTVEGPSDTGEEDLSRTGDTPALTLNHAGIYKIRTEKQTIEIPANLLDRSESDIKPAAALKAGINKEAPEKTFALIREIWWELALVALLLAVMEWYIFHKRRV